MENILLEQLVPTEKDEKHIPFKLGERVTFVDEVKEALINYHKLNQNNPNANQKWLKIAEHLIAENSYFSLLHIATNQSAYSLGTLVIEIDPNEDIEIKASSVVPISRHSRRTNYSLV